MLLELYSQVEQQEQAPDCYGSSHHPGIPVQLDLCSEPDLTRYHVHVQAYEQTVKPSWHYRMTLVLPQQVLVVVLELQVQE